MYCLSRNDTDNVAAFLTVRIARMCVVGTTSSIVHPAPYPVSSRQLILTMAPLSCFWQAGGIKAEAYHAGKADDKRIKVQNNWRSGNTQVRHCICATLAQLIYEVPHNQHPVCPDPPSGLDTAAICNAFMRATSALN